MFLCSLIEALWTKEENDKTGCDFNFGHECISLDWELGLFCNGDRRHFKKYDNFDFLRGNAFH